MIAALLFAAGAVSNALPPPPPEYARPSKEAARHMALFAQCVTRGQPAKVRALMATAPDSAESNAIQQALARSRGGCLMTGGRLTANDAAMRAAFAKQIYLVDYPTPLSAAPAAAGTGPAVAGGEGWSYAASYADCLTAADPVAADAWLHALRDKAAEARTREALAPAMIRCVGPGQRLRLSQDILHGLVAERLYRLRSGGAPAVAHN